ncbi:MAG TPA: hypothetical protein V6D20_13330 [Candidatus Obscuribacterales bacterium]
MQATFTQHLSLSNAQLQQLLDMGLPALLKSSDLQTLLSQLNVPLLQETLPTAGLLLAEHLPPFYTWLKTELGVQRVPDSPDHTTGWVVKFLRSEESITHLVELHRPVPRPALEAAIPRLVGLFETVPDDATRQAWQQAVAALCLVLAVAAREPAPADT